MKIQDELIKLFKDNGVADVGFTAVSDGPFGEKHMLSALLSDFRTRLSTR